MNSTLRTPFTASKSFSPINFSRALSFSRASTDSERDFGSLWSFPSWGSSSVNENKKTVRQSTIKNHQAFIFTSQREKKLGLVQRLLCPYWWVQEGWDVFGGHQSQKQLWKTRPDMDLHTRQLLWSRSCSQIHLEFLVGMRLLTEPLCFPFPNISMLHSTYVVANDHNYTQRKSWV